MMILVTMWSLLPLMSLTSANDNVNVGTHDTTNTKPSTQATHRAPDSRSQECRLSSERVKTFCRFFLKLIFSGFRSLGKS